MTSLHKGIIRGAKVDGVVFCSPQGEVETEQKVKQTEQDNLKALEDFWVAKGRKEGRDEAYQEGYEAGQAEGLSRGESDGLARGKEEGDATGYERGLEAGREKVAEEFNESIRLFSRATELLGEERENLVEQSRVELIHFCMAVCRSILQRELSDPQAMEQMIGRLIDEARPLAKKGEVEIFLSKEDKDSVDERLSSLTLDEEVRERLTLVVDTQLFRGDCRVETEMGLLNFSIERQLEEVEKKVLEVQPEEVEDAAQPEEGE